MLRTALISAAFAFTAAAARAETPPQPPTHAEVGHRIAERMCSRCHQINPTGDIPNSGSPPFRVLAKRYDEVTLGRKLDDIATGHYDMPPTAVTNDEIDSLVAYLESLPSD